MGPLNSTILVNKLLRLMKKLLPFPPFSKQQFFHKNCIIQWVPYAIYGIHKSLYLAIFSLKIYHTVLFTYLKFILLHCFQFSSFSKISGIQTDSQKNNKESCSTKILKIFSQHSCFDLGQITTYSSVVWPKFKLPICDLKFDTLLT